MSEERRDIDFSKLNLLGKLVYAGGAAARVVGDGVDRVLNQVADIVVQSEKAFRQGLDDNIEDAHIIEERKTSAADGQSPKRKTPPDEDPS